MSSPAKIVGGSGVVTWRLPGQSFSIHMRQAAAEDLQQRILVHAAAGAGGDCGVLIGVRNAKGDYHLHDTVPSPQGSCAADAVRALGDTVANLRTDGGRPIGFYRRHDEDPIRLDDGDLSLIRTHFTSTDSLFLLLKPAGGGGLLAGFFFWVEDTLGNQLLHPPLPFLSAAPEREETETSVPVRKAFGPATPLPAPTRPRLWLPMLSREASAAGAAALGVILVVALALGISRLKTDQPSAAAAKPSIVARSLGMRVEPQAGWLRLTWDRGNPEIVSALRAVLEVKDGASSERIQLDRAQLDAASVIYQPKTADIALRLTVYREEHASGTEVVRIVGYTPPSVEPLPPTAELPTEPASPANASTHSARRRPAARVAAVKTVPVAPKKLVLPPAPAPRPATVLSPPPQPNAPSPAIPSGTRMAASRAVTVPPPPAEEPEVRSRSPLRELAGGIARVGRGIGRFLAGASNDTSSAEEDPSPPGNLRKK